MTDSRQLSRLVESAEDFACVLQNLRDEVPPRNDAAQQRNLTDITSAIGELYRLSTVFQRLRSAFEAPQYTDRLYRISSDAALVANSAQLTLSVALGMVGRASPATHWMVWDDLSHRLQDVERVPLSMRLKWYHNLTEGLLDQLEGYPFDTTLIRIKASVQALLQQQKQQPQPESPRAERPVISYRYIESTSTTPRPPARITMPPPSPRPRPRRAVSDYSDTPRSTAPPPVPEVPSPQSPPVTWSSTRTAVSSDDAHSRRTSQSSYDAASSHWASYIFGGDKWRSRYRANQQQLDAVTRCKGDVQADAKLILQEDGFVPLESVHFSDNGSILTFYYRPQNGRARLLFTSLNPWGQEIHYCNPLTRLRAFRDGSILKLCMASSSDDQLFWTWAELKFIYHERMVLFYSTFVALKRQDSAGSTGLPTALIEDPRDMQEELLFSGTIRDREMFHVLRLLQDRGSGVLRLEARSYRGDRDEVPIWTAFLTKYIRDHRDRDFFSLEGRGVVSMICPKPKPYIFVPEYGLPLMSDGNFALQFVKRDDAAHLIEIWVGLCTSGRRS